MIAALDLCIYVTIEEACCSLVDQTLECDLALSFGFEA